MAARGEEVDRRHSPCWRRDLPPRPVLRREPRAVKRLTPEAEQEIARAGQALGKDMRISTCGAVGFRQLLGDSAVGRDAPQSGTQTGRKDDTSTAMLPVIVIEIGNSSCSRTVAFVLL